MKAKDKAEELIQKMIDTYYTTQDFVYHSSAKSCSLIAVDEILNSCYEVMKPFWEEVKQEIENYERTK